MLITLPGDFISCRISKSTHRKSNSDYQSKHPCDNGIAAP